MERGASRRLHREDADVRAPVLERPGHPGQQAAAAHRDEDRFDVGRLPQQLDGEAGVAAVDQRTGPGVDEQVGLVLPEVFLQEPEQFGNRDEARRSAGRPEPLDLRRGRGFRQQGERGDPAPPGRPGERQRRVPGADGREPGGHLLLAQLRDRIPDAAHLEGARRQQGVRLQQQLVREFRSGAEERTRREHLPEPRGRRLGVSPARRRDRLHAAGGGVTHPVSGWK